MEAYLAPIQYYEHVTATNGLVGHTKAYYGRPSLGLLQCLEVEFGQLDTNRLTLAALSLWVCHAYKGIMEPKSKSMSFPAAFPFFR